MMTINDDNNDDGDGGDDGDNEDDYPPSKLGRYS